MYKVIEMFTDLQDNGRVYNVGDTFPHVDAVVSESRIKALSSCNNRRRKPLIEEVAEKKTAPEKVEPEEAFMNPPVESADAEVVAEEVRPVRRRKQK